MLVFCLDVVSSTLMVRIIYRSNRVLMCVEEQAAIGQAMLCHCSHDGMQLLVWAVMRGQLEARRLPVGRCACDYILQ